MMGFFSVSPEALAGFAADQGVALKQPPPSEKWFTAEDGLDTVKVLIEEGGERQLDARVLTELREFQRVLEVAQKNGVRWHLAVDF